MKGSDTDIADFSLTSLLFVRHKLVHRRNSTVFNGRNNGLSGEQACGYTVFSIFKTWRFELIIIINISTITNLNLWNQECLTEIQMGDKWCDYDVLHLSYLAN